MNKKYTVQELIKLQIAGGILTQSSADLPKNAGFNSWEEYVNARFDMTDPEMVVLVDKWKKYVDARHEFLQLLNTLGA